MASNARGTVDPVAAAPSMIAAVAATTRPDIVANPNFVRFFTVFLSPV